MARGEFAWFELITPDPESARAFYQQVVGWGTHEVAPDGTPYTMWTAGEAGPVGGLVSGEEVEGLPEGAPRWLGYVSVGDADATVARARELGGQVLKEPTTTPGSGRFAVLRDPQGAVIALHAGDDSGGATGGEPAAGQFVWHELAATDHEAALGFYAELFGWQAGEAMDVGEGMIYQLISPPGRDGDHGGIFTRPDEMPGPPAWLHYVRVDDLDAACERIEEHGGTILHGPVEVPGGDRIVQALDPQGAAFALTASGS